MCWSHCDTGSFGVPLDVCAQSVYRAIKSVVEKVSNLSLREIHLVNLRGETTQFIQSVFLQLNSSSDDDGAAVSENPQPEKPLSSPEEENPPSSPDELSPSGDDSVPGVVDDKVLAIKTLPAGGNTQGDDVTEDRAQYDDFMEKSSHLLGHDEVLDHLPENVQTFALKTSSAGRNPKDDDVTEDHTQDRDITEDHVHLLVASEDLETGSIPEDEEVLDQEQPEEEQEPLDDQCRRSLPIIPDTSQCFEGAGKPGQKNLVGSQSLMEQNDKISPEDENILDQEQSEAEQESLDGRSLPIIPDTSGCFEGSDIPDQKSLARGQPFMEQDDKISADKVQGTEKILEAEDGDDQTFDVKINDQERKSLASSQALVDQDDGKLTNEVILLFLIKCIFLYFILCLAGLFVGHDHLLLACTCVLVTDVSSHFKLSNSDWVAQKTQLSYFVHIFANIDQFSQFFHQ